MSSQLFKSFLRKASSSEGLSAFIKKQAPPGPPPRQGLVWNPSTRRRIRDQSQEWHFPKDLSNSQFINDNKASMDEWFGSLKQHYRPEQKENDDYMARFRSPKQNAEVGVWSQRVDHFQETVEDDLIQDLNLTFSNDTDKEDFKNYVGEKVQRIWHAEIERKKKGYENIGNAHQKRNAGIRIQELVGGKTPKLSEDTKNRIFTIRDGKDTRQDLHWSEQR